MRHNGLGRNKKKTVMKLCSTRRDEGIPPLKVMASLLGLQWRACITCDPSNHVCRFWDQEKVTPKQVRLFFPLLKLGIDAGPRQCYKEETQTQIIRCGMDVMFQDILNVLKRGGEKKKGVLM